MEEKANINNITKYLSSIIAFLFIGSIFLSLTYMSMESSHHCEAENCPICETILICENNINLLCQFMAAGLLIYTFFSLKGLKEKLLEKYFIYKSLVNQGVRMNN